MIDAERGLLRWVMIDPSCLTEIDFIDSDDFLADANRDIWRACVQLNADGLDVHVVSVAEITD